MSALFYHWSKEVSISGVHEQEGRCMYVHRDMIIGKSTTLFLQKKKKNQKNYSVCYQFTMQSMISIPCYKEKCQVCKAI